MQGIYSITNKVNGKRYIGLSIDIEKRFRCHKSLLKNNKHCNIKLQRAWNKYGEEAFELEVLVIVNEKEKLGEIEVSLIKEYDSYKNGYNCSEGGEGSTSYLMTQEIKDKISKAGKGKKRTEESRQKLSKAKKEYPTRMIGEKNAAARFTEKEVIEIRTKYLQGGKIAALTREYNKGAETTVAYICKNKLWKHIPNTLEELLELQKTA